MTKMQSIENRVRKSVALTKEEKRDFIKYVSSFPTKIDAAYALGISRQTLDAVMFKGSGKPDTIASIREKMNPERAA